MTIDRAWLAEVRQITDLAKVSTYEVDGVPIELPRRAPRGAGQHLDWQRRVVRDIVPDSVNADATERMPFRLLWALTNPSDVERPMREALSEEFAPLAPLFLKETSASRSLPVAFHALAVQQASAEDRASRGFTERTFTLLCRNAEGELDTSLLEGLVNAFRSPLTDLDVAQRAVLERIQPGWTPELDGPTSGMPRFYAGEFDTVRIKPFDPSAGTLYRRDLQTLVDARLSPADFFQSLNMLLALHLGMYQPRIALLLNPQMDALDAAFADGASEALVARAAAYEEPTVATHPARRHPMPCRAPSAGSVRSISRASAEVRAMEALELRLATFHFNLLLLVRLRQLHRAWLRHEWTGVGEDALDEATRFPSQIIHRMTTSPAFHRYLKRALTLLASRFIQHQLPEEDHDVAYRTFAESPSALHGFRGLYARYDRTGSRNKTGTRAYRQGIQITRSLLGQGDYGLLERRRGVGAFFQLGAGMLPLLLLLTIREREKIPVSTFWDELLNYGLAFAEDEREFILRRLKSMGLYERFSDAGEASYVRNLIITQGAG